LKEDENTHKDKTKETRKPGAKKQTNILNFIDIFSDNNKTTIILLY